MASSQVNAVTMLGSMASVTAAAKSSGRYLSRILFIFTIVACLLVLLVSWTRSIGGRQYGANRVEGRLDAIRQHKPSPTTILVTTTEEVTRTLSRIVSETKTVTYSKVSIEFGSIQGNSEVSDPFALRLSNSFVMDQFSGGKPHNGKDLMGLASTLMLFSSLWNITRQAQTETSVLLNDQPIPSNKTINNQQSSAIIKAIYDQIFRPWAGGKFETIEDLFLWDKRQNQVQPDGIVINAGSAQFDLAVHTIRSVRALGTKLPIIVYHIGDLSLEQQVFLSGSFAKGVSVQDLTDIFRSNVLHLSGSDLKPFSLLASPFSRTILMDADAVWLQKPEVLFEDSGFQETGVLLFSDRTIWMANMGKNQTAWIHSTIFPPGHVPPGVEASPFYQNKSHHSVDSGVVVIERARAFLGLLAACQLNAPAEREVLRKAEMMHGDKETFWLGMEMVRQPYSIVPGKAGSIGRLMSDQHGNRVLCGKLLHLDRKGRLLWFNDGIVADKKKVPHEPPSPLDFDHWGLEGRWAASVCVYSETFNPIPPEEKKWLEKIIQLFDTAPIYTATSINMTSTSNTTTFNDQLSKH